MNPKTKLVVIVTLSFICALWCTASYLGLPIVPSAAKSERQRRLEHLEQIEKAQREQEADWKRRHPDGKAKDLADLQGASADDVQRNSGLMFEGMRRAKQPTK